MVMVTTLHLKEAKTMMEICDDFCWTHEVVVVTATRNNDDGIVQDDEEASARKFMIL